MDVFREKAKPLTGNVLDIAGQGMAYPDNSIKATEVPAVAADLAVNGKYVSAVLANSPAYMTLVRAVAADLAVNGKYVSAVLANSPAYITLVRAAPTH